MGCRLALCGECGASGQRNTCDLIHCFQCRTVGAAAHRVVESGDAALDESRMLLNQSLLGTTTRIEQSLFRPRTFQRHRASLKHYDKFIEATGFYAWPPSQQTLEAFAAYLIVLKHLDPATVSLAFGAISGVVQQLQALGPHAMPRPWFYITNSAKSKASTNLINTLVRDYKLRTDSKQILEHDALCDVLFNGFTTDRFGLQNQLFAVLATFLPARPNAVSHLRLFYTVVNDTVITEPASDVQFYHGANHNYHERHCGFRLGIDKNVNPNDPHFSFVPPTVAGFPFMDFVQGYILQARPISGNFLTAAPTSKTGNGWRDTPYGNFNVAFQSAITRAFGGDLDPKDFGGGTPRKSFAQLLNANGVPRHIVADICGWKLQQRDAMDGYMHTTPRMQLETKARLPGPSYN